MEKQERKNRKILTDNRLATVNKREVSLEGITSQMQSGEDGLYGIMREDKNHLLTPKISITPEDIASIPPLAQLRRTIEDWEKALKRASGRDVYIIKKALIEMRKDQYLIKQAYQRPIVPQKVFGTSYSYIPLEDASYLDSSSGAVIVKGISFMDIKVVRALLAEYSKIKEDSYDDFRADAWYLMQDFEDLVESALAADYPYYYSLVTYKIDKKTNEEISKLLDKEYGIRHTPEYISSLWQNKIPKLIVAKATEDFLIYEYNRTRLPVKKCSRCGQIKPANNTFFSRNSGSKDHLYSICKECRNRKQRKKV